MIPVFWQEVEKMAISGRIGRKLACVAFVAVLAGGAAAQAPDEKPAAVVNGETITLGEVDAVFKARPIEAMKLTPADVREIRKESLNMLIDELLVQQFLRKHAPSVPSNQVNKELKDLKESLQAQGQTLEEFCRNNHQTLAQVRNSVLSSLQLKAYLDAHLNEATLRKCYEENRDVFDDVRVRVSHILLRSPSTLTAAQREAARSWLRNLRQEIVSGKLSFAEAARQYSQDVSASRGGDLGEIPRLGAVEESFARAAFALKANEVSDVVQTEAGLHLIAVTDRKVGSPSTFETRTDKVRELAGNQLLAGILDQQRQTAEVQLTLEEEPATRPSTARSHFPWLRR